MKMNKLDLIRQSRTRHFTKLGQSRFSGVFASALGGGAIGSTFGIPGLLVGTAVGTGVGFMTRKKAENG